MRKIDELVDNISRTFDDAGDYHSLDVLKRIAAKLFHTLRKWPDLTKDQVWEALEYADKGIPVYDEKHTPGTSEYEDWVKRLVEYARNKS